MPFVFVVHVALQLSLMNPAGSSKACLRELEGRLLQPWMQHIGHSLAQVWENLGVIAVDVGAFREAISAGRRLLEIRQRFDDFDVCPCHYVCIVSLVADPAYSCRCHHGAPGHG